MAVITVLPTPIFTWGDREVLAMLIWRKNVACRRVTLPAESTLASVSFYIRKMLSLLPGSTVLTNALIV